MAPSGRLAQLVDTRCAEELSRVATEPIILRLYGLFSDKGQHILDRWHTMALEPLGAAVRVLDSALREHTRRRDHDT